MSIVVKCPGCQKSLSAPDAAAGKKARCPKCGTGVVIPRPEPAAEETTFRLAPEPAAPAAPPSPVLSATPPTTEAKPTGVQHPTLRAAPAAVAAPIDASVRVPWRMWLLLAAFLPLFWHVFRSDPDDLITRLDRTIEENPALAAQLEEMPPDDVYRLVFINTEQFMQRLPEHKLSGAHLSYFTWTHWWYAALSAVAFLGLTFVLFEVGRAEPQHLLVSALATATVGILLLLAFQWIADLTQGYFLTRGNIFILVLFYLVKLIGFSYEAASNPEYGFWASFAGFTFGVGLCEEFVKALPVIFRVQSNEREGWRAACAWGFASGVGFGVAEGIMYSSDYYNGMTDGSIYLVRFVSCVALHAVWSAAVGVTVWHNREKFHANLDWVDWLLLVLSITGVPMILHGLYDTLLKREFDGWAALVAAASLAWLFGSIAYALRGEQERVAAARRRFEQKPTGTTVQFH